MTDYNIGIFNTKKCDCLSAFNKPVRRSDIDFNRYIDFLHIKLTQWIPAYKMKQCEKDAHPEHAIIGGYLKAYTYEEAFRISFEENRLSTNWPKQRQMLLDLPNFDAGIFEEITGITPKDLEL